jgi:hypothetical protein
VKDVFAKKFLVPGEIPLAALARQRVGQRRQVNRSSALATNRQSTPWSAAMLAKIYLLKLEAAVRGAKEAVTTASTSRFVPVTLPAAKAF